MEGFQSIYGGIHPDAQQLLTSEHYWDLNHPDSPFSTNRVNGGFREFFEWFTENRDQDTKEFLREGGDSGFVFDRRKVDDASIQDFYDFHYSFHKSMQAEYGDMLKSIADANGIAGSSEVQDMIIEDVASKQGPTMLREQDDEILAVAFGQFVLEGKMDAEIKLLCAKAIERQLNPLALNYIFEEYRADRSSNLQRMLSDLQQIP